jgi:Predicted acetyltransferase
MHDFILETVEPFTLKYLRDMYLNELKGPVQDSIEEGIITYNADFVRISTEKVIIGYACIGSYSNYKGYILEYYLICKCRESSGDIIKQLAGNFNCKGWFVNTHDFFALPTMLDLRLSYEIDAYKFAIDKSVNWELNFNKNVTFKITKLEELKEVYDLVIQDGFYTGGNMETLIPRIKVEELYSLRINNKLIGIGFIGILLRTPKYADIAMIIDKKERNKGWGVVLVKALINKSRLLNIIPTAVCGVNNITSRKTLQKAGFHLDGCILLVNFPERT